MQLYYIQIILATITAIALNGLYSPIQYHTDFLLILIQLCLNESAYSKHTLAKRRGIADHISILAKFETFAISSSPTRRATTNRVRG